MNNFRSTKIGLATLTIIFLVLYGYFSTSGKPLADQISLINQGFSIEKVTLGNLGGFHILKNINYSDESEFYRLIIETELNRSTVTTEDITTPSTIIEEMSIDDTYQLKINLSDTETDSVLQDSEQSILPQGGVQGIRDIKISTTSESTVDLLITLDKQTLFRATSDNSGTIVLDILK